MSKASVIVLGGTGLIGSAVCDRLSREGYEVRAVNSKNYSQATGTRADLLINCNGNPYRYKAAQDPRWDFDASVLSVEKSLFDFQFGRYFYFSTIDVYNNLDDPERNHEAAVIDPHVLHPYGFHKWVAERLVEKYAGQSLILRCGTVVGPGMKKGPLFDLLQNEPLHMAIESELSLIDTETVAEAVAALAASPPTGIINLTGTGPASLRALCAASGLAWRLAAGAESVVYHYHLNNRKLREILPLRTSLAMGARFLENALKSNL